MLDVTMWGNSFGLASDPPTTKVTDFKSHLSFLVNFGASFRTATYTLSYKTSWYSIHSVREIRTKQNKKESIPSQILRHYRDWITLSTDPIRDRHRSCWCRGLRRCRTEAAKYLFVLYETAWTRISAFRPDSPNCIRTVLQQLASAGSFIRFTWWVNSALTFDDANRTQNEYNPYWKHHTLIRPTQPFENNWSTSGLSAWCYCNINTSRSNVMGKPVHDSWQAFSLRPFDFKSLRFWSRHDFGLPLDCYVLERAIFLFYFFRVQHNLFRDSAMGSSDSFWGNICLLNGVKMGSFRTQIAVSSTFMRICARAPL